MITVAILFQDPSKILARFESVILQDPGRSYRDHTKDFARSHQIVQDHTRSYHGLILQDLGKVLG